jgi:hypothetical protein
LLGLINGHFDIQDLNADSAVEDAEHGAINTGIGMVVPVERIIEMLEESDLKEMRDAAIGRKIDKSGAVED